MPVQNWSFSATPSYQNHSRLYWISQALSYLLLLPVAAIGFVQLARRHPQPVVLWMLAASSFLTCFIFFPLARYRIPVFDPVMIVCAAFFVSRFIEQMALREES